MEQSIEISQLGKNEIDETARMLALAFENMPSTLSILKGVSDVNSKQEVLFKGLLQQKAGNIYVAKDGDIIAGVMRVVQWPDCQMKPLEALKTLPLLIKTLGFAPLPRAMKMRGTWSKNDPKYPHSHLDPLGVHPNYQGKGVGTTLMKFYCEDLDKNNEKGYLETDKFENVGYYEKFGYRVIKEENSLDFPCWYMLREPITINSSS